MALILNIETSTSVCSVALGRDGKLSALKENKEGMRHASHLTVFVENLLKENKLSPSDLDGVAVSMGPGSYTGLRIGVSTAKGICFALGLPLIAINTLQAMAKPLQNKRDVVSRLRNPEKAYFCPMIDARRMEVYSALLDRKNEMVSSISATIVNEATFAEELSQRELVFFGDGSAKCKGTVKNKNAFFIDNIYPSATGMVELAEEKHRKQQFEDVAYFEPFYLKDFIATTPKKHL